MQELVITDFSPMSEATTPSMCLGRFFGFTGLIRRASSIRTATFST